jgi:hypothetical protein
MPLEGGRRVAAEGSTVALQRENGRPGKPLQGSHFFFFIAKATQEGDTDAAQDHC